ncbi:hypothetical protein NDY24_20405 [Xanthomonas hortorum pv. pelargonii]|nr:hypothetical protein NDY24_20405 [Xanthomonas hortorum pv. pelargonii]
MEYSGGAQFAKEPVCFQAVIAVEDVHCTLLVRWATQETSSLIQHRPEQQAVTRRRMHPIQLHDDSQVIEALAAMQGMRDIGKTSDGIINEQGRALRGACSSSMPISA